jgi:hypothetical protein
MKGLLTTALKVIASRLKGLQLKPALLALALTFFGPFTSQDFRSLPVTLHSLLTADYSVDSFYVSFPNINLSLILDVLGDQAPEGAFKGYETLQSSLLTPVASVTPLPGEFTQVPPSATPTPALPGPSVTPSSIPPDTRTPTPSLTPAATGTPTEQPIYTAQPTVKLTITPTKTRATQVRPTSTRSSQATQTPTQVPPTQAVTPTRKPPTATKPPTPTKAPHPYPAPTKPPTKPPYP